jgi:undecaprenyl pyrophosphate phosphatase UppP
MDLYLLWVAFILGIVEGITEFIPRMKATHKRYKSINIP